VAVVIDVGSASRPRAISRWRLIGMIGLRFGILSVPS
jgi:hypothetical protein